ncbi:hypothetical protein ACFY5D_20795 [Paeniglutamicibacter sp. NPDC012692]|uniref:hypothetical protein n=1 Tax=Paeniglutamicibacter sp. NPDC012692 TaxID=3364388 RepID=UPI0036B394A7
MAGCTAGESTSPSASTPPPEASSTATALACEQPIVSVLNRAKEKATFTAIRRVSGNKADSTIVLDSPTTPRIAWEVPPADWVQSPQVEEAIQSEVDGPISGQLGTLTEVDQFLKGISTQDAHVGYAAINPVTVDIMVTCSNIPRILGTVHTSEITDVGAATCDGNIPKGEHADLAQLAQKLYCN